MEILMSGKKLAALASVALLSLSMPALAADVNVYTYREPGLIKPLFDAFTAETGIAVNVIFAKDGLEERIAAEGANSPADMLLTVDIARLTKAKDLGITQPVKSATLEEAIPPGDRDAYGHWFGVSERARVFYASKDRVSENAMTYEDLADPKWKGKVCIRSGQHMYNLALLGAVIGKLGPEKARAWLEGVKANLARKPSGGDRDVAKDIAAGLCDIGVGNTYYVGLMQQNPDQKAWADAIKVIMPTFAGGGTHINLSGFAIAKNAPNKDNAVKLGEWLVSPKAQELYATLNFEYPVRAGVATSPTVQAFGELKRDDTPLATVAANRAAASEMVDAVGFDN
jgi:iron(III) transport system substrate-binding protein